MTSIKILPLLICFLVPVFSDAQTDPMAIVDSLVRDGVKLEQSRNFIGAIAKYKQAEVVIRKNNLGKSYEAVAHSLTGYAYYNNNNFVDATRFLKRSASSYEADSNTLHMDYCMVMHDIAVLSYYNLHQPIDSLCEYAMKAITNAYAVLEEDDPELAKYFSLAGFCKLESNDMETAKPFLLYGYELLTNKRDSFPTEFVEICGHLFTLYNREEQRDSSILFALEKLRQSKKMYGRKDRLLAEAYYTVGFALNVGNIIDSSIVYLDSALAVYPKVCEPKEKAEFYYRGGQYYIGKKDMSRAKNYFIQSGTYYANNKIPNTFEGSCWLWVGAILLQELKVTEAKPYLDKACECFKKDNGPKDSRTLQVCKMADAITNMDLKNLDLSSFFPEMDPKDLKSMLDKMVDPNTSISFGNDYTTGLLAEAKLNPNFKELPSALEAIRTKRFKDVIAIVQHAYINIIPGYKDSLNYLSDPNINSLTMQTNNFLLALLLKAVAYDQLGSAEKDIKKLNYAWQILEKCDTLMTNIRLNAAYEDIGTWSSILNLIYEQMITTSSKMFDATKQESYYDKTLLASERLKAFALLQTNEPEKLKSLVPAKLLDSEKKLIDKTMALRRDLTRSLQFQTYNKEDKRLKDAKEKVLQDSLFLAEANLATIRSDFKAHYPKYWEANNEKSVAPVRAIMGKLDNRTAIISYTCMIDETVSILVMTSTENSFIIEKPIPGVKSMVAKVSGFLSGEAVSKEDYTKAAESLYRELVVNLPANIEQLIIIPDGFLHNLPFEALLTSHMEAGTGFKAYPFLLKKYAISYGYSATLVYDQLKNKNKAAYSNFLLGYSSTKFHDFQGVKPIFDAKGLKYNIRDTKETATKADLLGQDLKKYKIVHITAHGRESTKTDILGIRLGGVETIYYGDLYKLETNADLFVLLGCLTGKGNVVTGEGVIGLNRALYAAGARNLLLFREELNNESNTFFCEKFYGEITHNNVQSYGKSLQKARIAMMNSDQYADPKFWAGYYLMGY